MSGGPGPDTRLLTEPVPRALLRLALPVLASQALRLAYQWVDAMWVKGLGVQATAAVTTSVFALWCVYALNDIFGAGLQAYVSQLLGAGERARAGVAVRKALSASLVMPRQALNKRRIASTGIIMPQNFDNKAGTAADWKYNAVQPSGRAARTTSLRDAGDERARPQPGL